MSSWGKRRDWAIQKLIKAQQEAVLEKMKNKKTMLFLVEKGWRGAREFSIGLSKQGIRSLCIVKGKVNREILDMITPWPGIKIISIRRGIYKIYIALMFFVFRNNFMAMAVDNEKTYNWISTYGRFPRKEVFKLIEQGDTYTLSLDGREVGNAEAIEIMQKRLGRG